MSKINTKIEPAEDSYSKTKYSPSRLSAFDGCKLQYKYGYIDKLHSEVEAVET